MPMINFVNLWANVFVLCMEYNAESNKKKKLALINSVEVNLAYFGIQLEDFIKMAMRKQLKGAMELEGKWARLQKKYNNKLKNMELKHARAMMDLNVESYKLYKIERKLDALEKEKRSKEIELETEMEKWNQFEDERRKTFHANTIWLSRIYNIVKKQSNNLGVMVICLHDE